MFIAPTVRKAEKIMSVGSEACHSHFGICVLVIPRTHLSLPEQGPLFTSGVLGSENGIVRIPG